MRLEKVKDILLQHVEKDKLFHAYILEGKNCDHLADVFANAITPYLEDIIYVRPDGLSVKDKAVVELQNRLSMKPLEGAKNVAIIKEADTLTVWAQNRLLKTLEEPLGDSVIILLSKNIENLLSTIVSRCIVFTVNEETEITDLEQEAKLKARTVGEMLARKEKFYFITKELAAVLSDRDRAYAFLDALQEWYHKLIMVSIGIDEDDSYNSDLFTKERLYSAIDCIEDARRDLNRNFNVGYSLKNMLLKLL
jgi:DNA polymerase-3 subunit delta'